jgi:uncharacterized LabA/DUF88 family protein
MLIYIFIKPCLFIAHKKAKQQGKKGKWKKRNHKKAHATEQKNERSKKSAPRRGFPLERSFLDSTALLKEEKEAGQRKEFRVFPLLLFLSSDSFKERQALSFPLEDKNKSCGFGAILVKEEFGAREKPHRSEALGST